MFTADIQTKIETELLRAEQARTAGNEGQARVCARRAAGAAVQGFFSNRQIRFRSSSAIDLLRQLGSLPELDNHAQKVIDHLLERVNLEFQLPANIDLLAEARWLVGYLNDTSGNISPSN